jgi:cbb3-type cytochrome oxidase maturation protein
MIGSANTALIIVWVTFAVLMLAAIVATLVWAVRSRQFSDQDHARRLPLESGIPGEPAAPSDKGDSHASS